MPDLRRRWCQDSWAVRAHWLPGRRASRTLQPALPFGAPNSTWHVPTSRKTKQRRSAASHCRSTQWPWACRLRRCCKIIPFLLWVCMQTMTESLTGLVATGLAPFVGKVMRPLSISADSARFCSVVFDPEGKSAPQIQRLGHSAD